MQVFDGLLRLTRNLSLLDIACIFFEELRYLELISAALLQASSTICVSGLLSLVDHAT